MAVRYSYFRVKIMGLVLLLLLMVDCRQEKEGIPFNRSQLEKDTQLSLPNDVILLTMADDGGRGLDLGYNEWLLYSSSGFTLPTRTAFRSTKTTVQVIESRKPNKRIGQPIRAFFTSWETGQLYFTVDLLQTSEGEFLLISRW